MESFPIKSCAAFFAFVATTGACSAGAAPALAQPDFAFRQTISTSGDAPAFRFALPLAVYQGTVRDDLGDLRIVNAAGEVVPYSLTAPRQPAVDAHPLLAMRILPTGGGTANVVTLDGRELDRPITALRLKWADSAADYSGRVKVEASDDLGVWQTEAVAAAIANLHTNGQTVLEDRVPLPPTRARFWRLSWVGPPPPFPLASVLAEPATDVLDALRASLDVTGSLDPADPLVYTFDLGAHLPVSRINVALPEENTVDGFDLASRHALRDPWRAIAHAGAYRIRMGGGEQMNAPLEIAIDRDRYWRVRINQGGGPTQRPLRLHVEWAPNEVTFLARGHGPFALLYGSPSAVSAQADLSEMPPNVRIARAELGRFEPGLGHPSGRSSSNSAVSAFPWRPVVIGLVVLGAIAAAFGWRLLRLKRFATDH